MGKVSEYAFINAKLRARIGKMHSSSVINDMIKASTLNEAISRLKDTDHSNLVTVYAQTGDLQAVELALLEDEINDYREVISYLKGREVELVKVLLEKVEIENVKNALRLWYSSVVRSHQIAYRSSYIYKEEIVHPVDYNAIINARDYEGVKGAFRDTIYEPVFDSFSLTAIKTGGLFDLEIRLDHLWFDRLFKVISNLKGEDRSVSEEIYLVDVDLKNILLFIRYSLYHHLGHEELKRVIIPYGKVYEDLARKRVFDKDDNLDDVREVVNHHYRSIMAEVREIRKNDDDMTGSDENAQHILMIEEYLAQTRKKEFLKILSGRPFNIGIALAYFFLYKDEDRMLRSIMSAKFYKWDEARIREAVL